MAMPERIADIRRYGIVVSDDGFYPTPTGPIHVDDSEMCQALLAFPELLAACMAISEQAEATTSEDVQEISTVAWQRCVDAVANAVANAEGK